MGLSRLAAAALVCGGVFTSACQTPAPVPADALPKVAAPDAGAQAFPTDLRRTSLIVSDIEESLRLYRDILGFAVNYDAEVTMSGVALPAGEPGAKARLVLLGSNDGWVGWIGLLQWLDPALPATAPPVTVPPTTDEARTPRRMGIGDAILVFNTEEVDAHCAAAKALPGVRMTAEASNTTYPGRPKADGSAGAPIVVRTCYLFDRDGYFMELNKVLDRAGYNGG